MVRDYSIHDLFYCMSFTVLGLCSLCKNDAHLVVLQLLVFSAVSFQSFCTNLLKKLAVKNLNFSLYFSSDFPAFISSSYGGPEVQHTNIFQNIQIYFKTQIYFKIHKYILQSTNIFQNTQIYFAKHKYISKYTNIFLSLKNTEINVETPK